MKGLKRGLEQMGEARRAEEGRPEPHIRMVCSWEFPAGGYVDCGEQMTVEPLACLDAASPREGSMGGRGTLSHQSLGPHGTPAPQTPLTPCSLQILSTL